MQANQFRPSFPALELLLIYRASEPKILHVNNVETPRTKSTYASSILFLVKLHKASWFAGVSFELQ